MLPTTTPTPTSTPSPTPTTTVTSDPGILCFHHCNVKVFCFVLPQTCPNCKAALDASAVGGDAAGRAAGPNGSVSAQRLLPFRLPYPFVRAAQYPCAIVLRPTTGDFLNDYNNAKDLHIAVTTSTGCIVEYDRNGLQRQRADNKLEWCQCLLVGDVPEAWYDYWDQVLLQICQQTNRWSIANYDEATHNCYTFVLSFLQALGHDKLSEAARSKTSFCEKYIVPRTTTAGKYISLYRKLRATQVYVHPQHSHSKGRAHAAAGKSTGGASVTVSSKTTKSSATATSNSIMLRPPTLCTIEE